MVYFKHNFDGYRIKSGLALIGKGCSYLVEYLETKHMVNNLCLQKIITHGIIF